MDTVLIVDDSSFIVEGLIAFLKKKYLPLAAYGGAECLDILTRKTPSVIILDIMMEPMDGWETLARIKENPATRNIPVLMFSAKKISTEEAEEHRMRIDDFITKPVSPKKIIEAIEKVLTRRDTNLKVIETWKSAGMSREKIDEYLSLVTSLEVDLSLCQNMKIQYDLVHPADKNHEEFQAVIAAIEDRIRHERELIDTLAREMNDALADTPVHPGKGAVPESGSRPEITVPAGADTTYPHVQPGTGETLPGKSPADGQIPVIPSLSQTGPEEDLFGTPPVEPAPSAEVPEISSSVVDKLTENGETSGNAGINLHAGQEDLSEPPGTAPAEEKPALEPASTPGVPPPGSVPADRPGIPQTVSERERSPDAPDTIPRDEDRSGYRPMVPADPDVPLVPRNEPPTGAGTDIPMAWEGSREWKKSVVQPPVKPGPSAPVPPVPGGLVGRIIAIVTGLFRKK
jgi:CheY-like chemotaxis protein